MGDQVLAAIGKTLAHAAREDEAVARLGGDEFMLLVPGADIGVLKQRARELSDRLDGMHVPVAAQPHYRGASVGVALAEEGEPPQLLIRRASEQMRRQKRRRKGDRAGAG